MRLFTGIPLPDDVIRNLERLLRQLRPTAQVKWRAVENLHVTTKFIGEWPADELEELKAELRGLKAAGEISVAIRGLGWFPNERAPRVFWAGVEASPGLRQLAEETDQRLSRLGIERESRRFSPHLTLARIKGPTNLDSLRRTIAELPTADFGAFTADSFHLYLSELRPAGSVYTSLAEFPLG